MQTIIRFSRPTRLATLVGGSLAALLLAAAADAGLILWSGGADGTSFGSSGNWSPASVPGVVDHSMFDGSGGLIGLGLDRTNLALTVDDASVTLDLGGSLYTVGTASTVGPALTVGDGGLADLIIDGPGTLDTLITILGNNASADGALRVAGSGTSFIGTGEFVVGNNGTGALEIVAGGSVVAQAAVKLGDNPLSLGVASMSGAGSDWTCNDRLVVGNFGDGSLSMTGGTLSTSRVRVADEAGSTGVVTVQGAASTWNDSVVITVGHAGSGSLAVRSGASITSPRVEIGKIDSGTMLVRSGATLSTTGVLLVSSIGDEIGSNGTLTVRDAGTVVTFDNLSVLVGNLGDGLLRVLSGATVSTADTFLGDDAGSAGRITVQGAGSSWSATGPLFLGNAGTGALAISNGGSVSCDGLVRVGDEIGSSGTISVSGDGSQLDCAQELFLGNYGSGTLEIADGGVVSTNRTKIGDEIGSTGAVLVAGPGSAWQDSIEIFIGNFGTGELSVAAGGVVSAPHCTIGDDPASSGAITVDGEVTALTVAGNLDVGDLGDGTVFVEGGGSVQAGVVTIGAGVGSSGLARVRDVGSTLTATSSLRNGVSGSGELRLINRGTALSMGSYTQGGLGTLTAVVGPASSDMLTAAATVTLGGQLDVTLVSGFTPTPGSSVTIIAAGVVTGVFAVASVPDGTQLVYEANAVRLVADGVSNTIEAVPVSFSVARGTLLGGTVDSLLDSDNDRVRVRSAPQGTNVRTDTRIVCNSSATTASRLDLLVEIGVNVEGIKTLVYLRNFTTNKWDRLDVYNQPTGDTVRQYPNVANPANYINGSGRVKLRLMTKSPATTHVTRIDHVEVLITP